MTINDQTSTAPASGLTEFFRTKTAGDVDGTMAYFAPDMVTYIDATLGLDFASFAALKAVFDQYMPTWAPPAAPTRPGSWPARTARWCT